MLFLLITCLLLNSIVTYANPIPVPTLIIEYEYISIRIVRVDSKIAEVTVCGIYPFVNEGYNEVTMYFPVPPEVLESRKIRVLVDNYEVSYGIEWEGEMVKGSGKFKFKYDTVLGDFPLITWKMKNMRETRKFTVKVFYQYNISISDNTFITLYAMATGRFLDAYAKRCTAYITINLVGFKNSNVNVSLVPPPTLSQGATKFTYNVLKDNETINLIEKSPMFHSIIRDVLIAIKPIEHGIHNTPTWKPGKPTNIDVIVTCVNGILNITVELMFPHGGYNVEWGSVELKDNIINVPIKVSEYTGYMPQVLTLKTNTYTLKTLKSGSYTINVYVNHELMKTISINVETPQSNVTTTTYTLTLTRVESQVHYAMLLAFIALLIALLMLIVLMRR